MDKQNQNIINSKEEFNALYFDKLLINGIDYCMRLNKGFTIHIEKDLGRLDDYREKNMETCLEKYFSLHSILDNNIFEYLKKNDKNL
jgi:hypothetical protein